MQYLVARWHQTFLGACALLAASAASAQFEAPPAPGDTPRPPSNASNARDYRRDGAHHIYAAYREHIYKGKLPPLLYGIAIVETEIDEAGNIVGVTLVRKPAAPEVGPWVMEMIRNLRAFPPARMGRVKYLDIWLVHKSGKFQLDALTEGQL
jgi:hypothetical protein